MRRDGKGSILRDIAEMPTSDGINLPSMEEMFPLRNRNLTPEEINYLFPVIQISNTGSTLRQVIEEKHGIRKGISGLAQRLWP